MLVTPLGIETVVNAEQPEKAEAGMFSTSSEKVTECTLLSSNIG